jgi:two-component system, NarL family, sensor histidine kinase UhpB
VSASASRRGYVPLLHRVAGLNAVLVLVTVAVTVAVLSPGKISSLALDGEIAVLVAAVAAVVAANVFVLRRLVGPVQALTALARRVDLTTPSERMPAAESTSEAAELAATFNDMLARLQAERRDSAKRALAAQESERLRIAQELHDQVGQELTAVLLGLSRLQSRSRSDDALRGDIVAVEDAVRASLDDVRRIAIELRPEALDDLGLPSALAVLAKRLSERLGLDVSLEIAPDLPQLTSETELVIYRVAQEALTNVARHAGARRAEVRLGQDGETLRLSIRDRGRGLPAEHEPGTGMRGMRERATLIGAKLEVSNLAPTGCEVRLDVGSRLVSSAPATRS